jgi:hypothetical protein
LYPTAHALVEEVPATPDRTSFVRSGVGTTLHGRQGEIGEFGAGATGPEPTRVAVTKNAPTTLLKLALQLSRSSFE